MNLNGKQISRERALRLNPLVLAYVGDAVHALWLKSRLAVSSDRKAGALSKISNRLLSARAQSEACDRLSDFFDETEKDVFRRARNCHNNTPAKNATLEQYKKATGLEAVLGFLYVSGDAGRILELLNAAYEKGEESI